MSQLPVFFTTNGITVEAHILCSDPFFYVNYIRLLCPNYLFSLLQIVSLKLFYVSLEEIFMSSITNRIPQLIFVRNTFCITETITIFHITLMRTKEHVQKNVWLLSLHYEYRYTIYFIWVLFDYLIINLQYFCASTYKIFYAK